MGCASVPELSTITRRMVWVGLWRTKNIISRQNATPSSGTRIVPMMKPLVFTRVRYSRLMIRRSLRTGGPIDKDFVQRGFEKLEARDGNVRLHGSLQDFPRVGAGLQFGFHTVSEARDAGDCRVGQKTVAAGELDMERVLTVRLLDGADFAVEDVAAFVDQANRIAHSLHLFHAVRGEDDSGTFRAHLEHDFFHGGGVYGIEAGEGLVENHERRLVDHGGDELDLLLHTLGEI